MQACFLHFNVLNKLFSMILSTGESKWLNLKRLWPACGPNVPLPPAVLSLVADPRLADGVQQTWYVTGLERGCVWFSFGLSTLTMSRCPGWITELGNHVQQCITCP